MHTGETVEVEIGVLTPRTGAKSDRSADIENGAQQAIEHINDLQTRYEFSLVFSDTKSDGNWGRNAGWMLTDAGVAGIVGGESWDVLSNSLEMPFEEGTPVVNHVLDTAAFGTIEDPNNLLWQVAPNEADAGQGMAMYANVREFTQVAIMHVDNAWGNGYADVFETYWDDPICKRTAYDASQTDFFDEIDEIAQGGCDDIVLISTVQDAGKIIDEIKAQGLYDMSIIAADPVAYWEFEERLQSPTYTNRVTGVTPVETTTPTMTAFEADFEARWGAAPGADAAGMYDATMMMALAILDADSTEGAQVSAALAGVGTMYDGVSGLIDWNASGETSYVDYEMFAFKEEPVGESYFEHIGTWNERDGIGSICRTDNTPITIGLLSPQTGPYAAFAQNIEEGAQLSITNLNLLYRDYCFSMITEDSGGTADSAGTAAQALIDGGAIGIAGPMTHVELVGAANVTNAAQMPLMTYGSLGDWSAFNDGGYLWRLIEDADSHGAALAAHAGASGATNVAIIHVDDGDGSAMATAFEAAMGAEGVCSVTAYAADTTDFGAVLPDLSACDGIMLAAHPADGLEVLRALSAGGHEFPIYTTATLGDAIIETAPDAAELLEGVTGVRPGVDHDTAELAEIADYVFNMNYGHAPGLFAAHAADASLILAAAAMGADSTGQLNGDGVNTLIESIADGFTSTATGEVTLDPDTGELDAGVVEIWGRDASGVVVIIATWTEAGGYVSA